MEECLKGAKSHDLELQAMEEVDRALQLEMADDYTPEEMADFSKKVSENIKNPDSLDGVNSLSKVALLARKHGMLPYYLAKIIAGHFTSQSIAVSDIKEEIRHFCHLNEEVELTQLIFDHYKRMADHSPLAENSIKVARIKAAYEAGFKYERTYRGCAQCTLAALFDVSKKSEKVLFQASSALAAGMGLFGDGACGGYLGGLLFMGTYAGRRLEFFESDKEQKEKSYEMSKKLHDRFMNTYGTIICQEIHEKIFGRAYHLRNSEEKALFETAGAHTADKCTVVVATAAQWATEILLEDDFI